MNRKYKMIKPESDDYSFFGFFAAVQGTASSATHSYNEADLKRFVGNGALAVPSPTVCCRWFVCNLTGRCRHRPLHSVAGGEFYCLRAAGRRPYKWNGEGAVPSPTVCCRWFVCNLTGRCRHRPLHSVAGGEFYCLRAAVRRPYKWNGEGAVPYILIFDIFIVRHGRTVCAPTLLSTLYSLIS